MSLTLNSYRLSFDETHLDYSVIRFHPEYQACLTTSEKDGWAAGDLVSLSGCSTCPLWGRDRK